MSVVHKVRSGECISSIAHDNGFFWETLWNHAENADLKRIRKNPNILLPGDRVYIPDIQKKTIDAASEKTHHFKLKGVPAKLRLRLMKSKVTPHKDSAGGRMPDPSTYEDQPANPARDQEEPRAKVPYILVIDGSSVKGKTDGDGRIEVSLPPNARRGILRLDPGTTQEQVIALDLGGMDPVTEICGIKKRLNNLGYSAGAGNEITPAYQAALRAWQAQNNLKVTGEADDATRDKLLDQHGS
jgi:hypothetical protein